MMNRLMQTLLGLDDLDNGDESVECCLASFMYNMRYEYCLPLQGVCSLIGCKKVTFLIPTHF